jgi:hypothetical protein
MSATAIIAAGKKIVLAKESIEKLIEEIRRLHALGVKDYEAWKTLHHNFSVTVRGENVGRYDFQNEQLCIVSSFDRNEVEITVFSFEWFQKLWNGVSLLKDKDDGGFEASLIHDVIASFAAAIAAAHKVKARAVLRWSDKILVAVWMFYAKKKGQYCLKLRLKLWVILHGLYHAPRDTWRAIMQAGAALLVAFSLAGCGGCIALDDFEVIEGDELIFSEKPKNVQD